MSRPHNKVTVNWSSHIYFSDCQNMVMIECAASISLALISEVYCNNPNTHQTISSPEVLSKAIKVRIACMYSKVCGLLYAFPAPDNFGRWIGAGFVYPVSNCEPQKYHFKFQNWSQDAKVIRVQSDDLFTLQMIQ